VARPEQADHPPLDLQAAGDRIEALLVASAAGGAIARERSEELVRIVADLYGAGIERILDILHGMGRLDDDVLAALAADSTVSSLLLVHGLHPYAVEARVERALDDVRPYLGSHGGDVRLLEVTDEGVVRLEMLGSCDGCASSAVTLELAVDSAIRAAAPEIAAIEVVSRETPAASGTVIAIDQLTSRIRASETPADVSWKPAAALHDLAVGALHRTTVEGLDVLLCRLQSGVYAYRDACAGCGASFEGAGLQRAPSAPGSAVLTCRRCGAHYDIRRAGVGVDDPAQHLDPVPLLERDGVVEVALRRPVPA
jgi:Fe-S cluster biogenesis protein NfuA/nitrite reductase/ring-hydroxylating ferredoxin subunit